MTRCRSRALVFVGALGVAACAVVVLSSDRSRTAASPFARVLGVELPLAGDAGAQGIAARAGVQLALEAFNATVPQAQRVRALVRDTAGSGFANPHVDEGRDESLLPSAAATEVTRLARAPGVVAIVGGLHAGIAAADARAAHAAVPLVTLAPLPDDCAAAGFPPSAATGSRSIRGSARSVSGGASLESLAVASIASAPGFGRVTIEDDGTPLRHAVALCLQRALAAAKAKSAARRGKNFPSPAGAVFSLAFVGPAQLGTLLCARRATLDARLRAATAHRGYDSRDVPSGCVWVRRIVRPAPGAAARYAAFVATFHKSNGYPPPPEAVLAYDAAGAALRALAPGSAAVRYSGVSATLRACAGGSADGVWFTLVASTPDEMPLFVPDARCSR